MRLYHRTHKAALILSEGFRDGKGYYMAPGPYPQFEGVWLSDMPLWEGVASGNVVLMVDMPEKIVRPYEWREEGKTYREFLVPPELVNRYRPFEVADKDWYPV